MNEVVSENGEASGAKDASVEKVTMGDGRVVEFAGKRKLLKETLLDEAGNLQGVRLDFRNGETRLFAIPDALFARFAGHGAEQKYGDATAGCSDVDDMVLSVDKLHKRIEAGQWTTPRESSGMAGTSVLLRALVELSGKPVEAIKAFLEDKTAAEKLALRNSPQLKPIIDKLEAEKVSKSSKVDTAALFAQIA